VEEPHFSTLIAVEISYHVALMHVSRFLKWRSDNYKVSEGRFYPSVLSQFSVWLFVIYSEICKIECFDIKIVNPQ
jgi:hypothetical protein